MDSLTQARRFYKYAKAIKNRELIRLPLYITERCDSRCKTCHIWAKRSQIDMPIEMIKNILRDAAPDAVVTLLGGEPIMHPQIEEILELLRGREYMLVTNGMNPVRVEFLVTKYSVPYVILSCDGTWEAYKNARGVDNYDNVVLLLKNLRGKTKASISYTISYWNSREELLKIVQLCKDNGATIDIQVYDVVPYFNNSTTPTMMDIYKADDVIGFPFNKILRLHSQGMRGECTLPCYAARYSCQIEANGDVQACGRRYNLLGNLNTQSLAEIWNSPHTFEVQKKLVHCNGCWGTCYRGVEMGLTTLIPKFVLERIMG